MSPVTPGADPRLTRRSLLQAGAATGALLALGGPAGAPALAATVPAHLRRSGYAGLTGSPFAASTATGTPVSLRLAEVADLARAAHEPAFAGREDAFALLLTGPAGTVLDQGVHELRHDALGRFPLFLTPVGPAGAAQAYEAVVDRSVPFGDAADAAPGPLALSAVAPADAPLPAGGTPEGAPTTPGRRTRPGRVLRAAVARRGGVLSADVRVNRARRLVTVQVSLVRDGIVLARGAARLRGRGAVRIPLREVRRAAAGEYTLVVTTKNRDGRRATTRRRAWLAR